MGKKAKSIVKINKAAERKIDKSTLPPPPPHPSDEIGSAKAVTKPNVAGDSFKLLGSEGYDDGGVADLSLLVDLDDNVLRRKRGETEYFTALRADLLPRATKGTMAKLSRRDQKVSLAQLLFSEEDDTEKGPSEVYLDNESDLDKNAMKKREERLTQSRAALRLSLLLREPSCLCISLSELSKRRLAFYGKEGATDALRCADKAIEVASGGFWDRDEIALEAEDAPVTLPANHERNATSPGLAHATSLKYCSLRVSQLCLRSAQLQKGNCLSAQGKHEEARQCYEIILPLLENEPRCARVDWERHSLFVNIGNSYSRMGSFDKADEFYILAEKLGTDHLNDEGNGSRSDGKNMVMCAKRARAFALKKAGRIDEAKKILTQVVKEAREIEMEREKLEAEKLLVEKKDNPLPAVVE